MALQPWFLHADLDAFFASVEQMDHPEYRGKPVIVGGLPTDLRSVVSTASYEARKFGVHSAMPTREAYKLCPHGIYTHGNYKRYSELSCQIMEIFKRFSPNVQQMSIDEAFIDLTGTERLFGPPEETAMKIKEAVKKEIGLTVSIGLAQSKYFAKLSSEINKPDGFYFMKPGTETAYMTSIPIEKIWGIGKKTAARIKESGVKTTKQLYELPLETLIFMYGDNTATFLYNILRGKCEDMFGTEAKTHSISNERTFPVDIYDYYTNETVLLELAHSVMFRLLKDNLRSRTVVIKIRYDDFTTVSARQTFESDIITLDTFFEKVRELFNKKYERNRGVRLLGVGFDNVTTEPAIYQQSLFDDGQKKKQAVEKAILEFEKKYPDLPVKKARVIDNKYKAIISFVLLSLFCLKPFSARAKEILPVPKEAPEQLFDISLEDSQVEFFASGYWKAETGASMHLGFPGNGFGFGGFVFKQEVNLDFTLLVNKNWFFEAAFADEFKKNTITFGYQNEDNEDIFVKKAVISNRNILYPDYYSSSVFNYNPGGGNNQSPGFFMNMAGQNWKSDLMVRYDMVTTGSAVFYGMNEVNDTTLSTAYFTKNKFYHIPGEYITKITGVYFQSNAPSKATYKDSKGKTYQKLVSGKDYFLYRDKTTSLLILNTNSSVSNGTTEPSILVALENDSQVEDLISFMGSYENPATPLGKLQALFSASKTSFSLKNFSYDFSEKIEGQKVLVIQSEKKFSPFQDASIYDGGLNTECFVNIKGTETPSDLYSVKQTDYIHSADLMSEKRNYFKVFKENSSDEISSRFPFAEDNPEIYLFPEGSSLQHQNEIVLRTLYPVNQFQINSSADPQMVRVYINGIQDTSAVFDSETGIITLSKQISSTDKIYVTWQEESTTNSEGALTAGAGFQANLTENLILDGDITAFWPLSPYTSYSSSNDTQSGFVSLNQGTLFESNSGNLKIRNNLSVSLTNNDVTGKKLVYNGENTETETFYQRGNGGYISYKDPELNELLGADFIKQGTITPQKDQYISGWKVPLEIDFSSASEGDSVYTAMNIALPDFVLCDQLNIALKPQWKEDPPANIKNWKVFLQFGVDAESESESTANLPYRELTEGSSVLKFLDMTKTEWQEISIQFTKEDKEKLTGFHDVRLVVLEKNHSSINGTNKGFLSLGPYETVQNSLYLEATDRNEDSASDYFYSTALLDYKKLTFEFKTENLHGTLNSKEGLVFCFSEKNTRAVEIKLDSTLVDSLSQNQRHTISLELAQQKSSDSLPVITLDGTPPDPSLYSVYINRNIVPDKVTLSLNNYDKGKVYIGKVFLTETNNLFRFQDSLEGSWSWKKYFTFLTRTNYSLNTQINAPKEEKNINHTVYSYAESEINLFDFNINADVNFTNNITDPLLNGGHKLSYRNSRFTFLKFIDFNESYRFNNEANSFEKNNYLSLNFAPYKVPLSLSTKLNQKTDSLSSSDSDLFSVSYNGKYVNGNLSSSWNQSTKETNSSQSKNYFTEYADLWKENFDFGNPDARTRKEDYSARLQGKIPVADISPFIQMELFQEYTKEDSSFQDKETITFGIPFKIQKNNFAFQWTKTADGTRDASGDGGKYISDSELLFKTQKDRLWFYKEFPVFDLFNKKLPDSMNIDSSLYQISYDSAYSFRWNRSLYNSIHDFYIPNSAVLSASRNISSSVTKNESYSFQIEATSQSFNMFGSEGKKKLFNWYEDDEFISSSKITLKNTPASNSSVSFALYFYGQSLLFIDKDNSIKASFDLNMDNRDFEYGLLWNSKGNFVYAHTGTKSPLASIIDFCIGEIPSEASITRKENFSMELGKNTSGNFQSFELSHDCEVNFLKYYSVYCSAAASFTHKESASTLGLSMTLGGKMIF